MSLKHSLLVLLARQPATGYDLSRQFKGSVGFFWNASHQQVYQQLKQMHADGWLSYQEQAQTDRPDKKIYQLTAAGQEALSQWLAGAVAPPKTRDALLVKLYAGELAPDGSLVRELRQHLALHEKNLKKLLQLEADYLAMEPAEQKPWHLPYLTLKRGISGERAWLDWARECLAELETPDQSA